MWQWFAQLFAAKPAQPAVHPLLLDARSPDAQRREQAAEQLGQLPDRWAQDHLLKMLADTHTTVRTIARQALHAQGVAAIPALLAGMKHGRLAISVTAVELLGATPSAEAVEPLLVALRFSERDVQNAARRALGLHGALAVPALRAALDEPQPWVQRQIQEALADAEQRAASSVPTPAGVPERELA